MGWTPIIEAPRLAKALGIGRLRLKDDGRNPSGSFKDRPSSVGVQRAMQVGREVGRLCIDRKRREQFGVLRGGGGVAVQYLRGQVCAAGKAGAASGVRARVFRVQGSYAQAYDLCKQACAKFGWYNRNAAINPYLVEGKKTGGMEAAEQTGRRSAGVGCVQRRRWVLDRRRAQGDCRDEGGRRDELVGEDAGRAGGGGGADRQGV